jgi:tetratricopeptide (TPR) repeat protein
MSDNPIVKQLEDKALDCEEKGDTLGAIAAYRQALDIEPSRISSLRNLAKHYDYCERFWDALECHNKCLEANPNDDMTWNDIATMLMLQKFYRLAIDNYQKVIDLNPKNPYPIYWMARCYYHLQEHTETDDRLFRCVLRSF